MRLFLLPISTRRALVYCQKITRKPPTELSYIDRATKKAVDTWAGWEQKEKGWQKTVTKYGNQGLQRIPYEEWGLKSFPPLNHAIQAEDMAMMAEGKKFDVVYPANIMSPEDAPLVLARLAKERKQLHWRRFIGCLIGMPLTVPFALIPVIPNIPFFYVAFRCWSHWRALRGSDHLDFMLDHRILRFISTPEIENIYKKAAPDHQHSYKFVTKNQVLDGDDPKEPEILLLTPGSHVAISQELQAPELNLEVERAVMQVETSLRKQEDEHQQAEKEGLSKEKTARPVPIVPDEKKR